MSLKKGNKMEIIRLKINDITPYEKNAKIHTEAQIEQIKKSIQEFGMNDPIAVWGDKNTIVEGHGRLEALKQLGYTEIDCIRLDHLTDEERKAYTLAHNKINMNTGFDIDLLDEELDSIEDIDMEVFGFDLDIEHATEHFKGDIAIENMDWNVGLIVGGSGTGKSTIAKEVFGNEYICKYQYKSKSVIDDMPKGKSIKDIEKAFKSVGFASPPSWLKPYNVLSNGEKMRVDLARNILDDKELIVFDEFTSVVNREVAKTSSYAISKAVKKQNKKFVAISCHSDIIEWLEPDWIYSTDEKAFFAQRGDSTAPQSNLRYTGLITKLKKEYGKYLESITI